MADGASPASQGFRMPAEWEPHHATWIGWPHNASDWPGKLAPIQWVYGEIVRKLVPGEMVRILVNSAAHERRARGVLGKVGGDPARLEFFRFPTNRGWTRDFGPLFVVRASPRPELAVARFRFNAWAKYPDWKRDDKVPELAANRLGLRLLRARVGHRDVVLEGGSIDVNGRGTLLTTEDCLLDPAFQVRNPDLSRAELERALRDQLSVTNVLWLGKGIAGDDTHGHVDDLCRFVDARTVVLCSETDPHDANFRALHDNRERLEGMRQRRRGEDRGRPLADARASVLRWPAASGDRKSTRLNSSHSQISYAVFCLKKKKCSLSTCTITTYLPPSPRTSRFSTTGTPRPPCPSTRSSYLKLSAMRPAAPRCLSYPLPT